MALERDAGEWFSRVNRMKRGVIDNLYDGWRVAGLL